MNEALNLKWTGHPLADVGVATLCAMVNKSNPEEMTLDDLDECGKELLDAYSNAIFLSYLTCVFPNSAYVQPAMKVENRNASMKRLLFPHRSESDEDTSGLSCVFSGQPASHFLERTQMPMLTGTGVMNFYAAGRSALAVSAPFVLAIQALPLGGRRSEGKLLIVHCDDPRWTLQFANRYLATNRRLINLAKSNLLPNSDGPTELLERECAGFDKTKNRPKYPDAKAPQSLLMADLIEIAAARSTGAMSQASTSVTAYLMSNSGQGPSLSIEHVPSQFIAFLEKLVGAEHSHAWNRVVSRAWQATKQVDDSAGIEAGVTSGTSKPKPSKPNKSAASKPLLGPGRSRNELYNDLLRIFESGFIDWNAATRFIRRHLLSDPTIFFADTKRSPHGAPKLKRESAELINWKLTSHFLHEVLGMNTDRIEQIRKFGDQLASLILEHNDKRLFRDLVFTTGEWQYRSILTKVQRQYAQDRKSLLLTFDDYLNIFLATDESERTNWSLVRDLISIRLVEELFNKKFFDRSGNEDALNNKPEDQEAA